MINLPPFEQRDYVCGPAALRIIFKYYNINKTEKQIINILKAKKLGVEAEDLLRVAKRFGLKGKIKDHAELKDLVRYVRKKKIPVIVEWFLEDDGHFSVVSDIDRENVYLQDPALGHMRAMTRQRFLRVWFTFPGVYMKKESDIILRRMLVLHK